jgi:hygromycin-B 4-O-kinase
VQLAAKPALAPEEIARLLSEELSQDVELEGMHEGLESQAFTLLFDGVKSVVRINYSLHGFKKDQYAAENFASGGLPVPPVLKLGWLDETHAFSITEFATGFILQDIDPEVARRLAAAVFETWRAMQAVQLPASAGYGEFDGHGRAPFDTWQGYLLDSVRRLDWTGLGVGQSTIAALESRVEELAPACPSERRLIHGDFGADNLLSDGERITAVLDWELAAYGDPLFDVATAHFWAQGLESFREFARYSDELLEHLPAYRERLHCYQAFQALGVLHYFARNGPSHSLAWTQERVQRLIEESLTT